MYDLLTNGFCNICEIYECFACALHLAVTWQNQECRLTLHYDNGFTLADSRSADDSNPRKSQILWHYPYEKLRMSADDSSRLLWLDFGEEGEQVFNIFFQ